MTVAHLEFLMQRSQALDTDQVATEIGILGGIVDSLWYHALRLPP